MYLIFSHTHLICLIWIVPTALRDFDDVHARPRVETRGYSMGRAYDTPKTETIRKAKDAAHRLIA